MHRLNTILIKAQINPKKFGEKTVLQSQTDLLFIEDNYELQDVLESGLVGLFLSIFSEKTGLQREWDEDDIDNIFDSKPRMNILKLLTIQGYKDLTIREIEAFAALSPWVARYHVTRLCRRSILTQQWYGGLVSFRLHTEDLRVKEMKEFLDRFSLLR